MASSTWRSGVNFSERLSLISTMLDPTSDVRAVAYRHSNSSAEPQTAQTEAQKLEAEAFDQAVTKEDYQEWCRRTIDKLERSSSNQEVKSTAQEALFQAFADYESQPGIELGVYKKAVYVSETPVSTIYKARRSSDFVALKVTSTRKELPPHDSRQEVRIQRRVSVAGTGVLPLLDAFREEPDLSVLVFPYMPHTLEELLHQQQQGISARQAQSHLRDLFSALTHLHSLGIIHRDVKPSNILVESASGPAYLGDFGIAWDPASQTGFSGSKKEAPAEKVTDVGTTCYRAPEILFGDQAYGVSLDLWAAGCVVAEVADAHHHRQLFDAGPLGSELALIKSIFTTLGTPNTISWPSAKELPDWGKVEFTEYPAKPWDEILPDTPHDARDLVSRLVRFESSQRLSSAEALQHPYLAPSLKRTLS